MTARRRPWPEYLGGAIVVLGLLATLARFALDAKLPQPFVFDSHDTLMDWYNTAWWAYAPGAFDVWHSVYPPLSFVVLRLLSTPGCYADDAFAARDCDPVGIVAVVLAYIVTAVTAALAFRWADRTTATPRSIAFVLGLPLLFAFERGNLILLCLPAFILLFGGLAKARWARAAAAAVFLNFKPYLLVPLVAWILERRWRTLKLTVLLALALYLITYWLFGAGDPARLAANTLIFAGARKPLVWEQGLYATSFAPFFDFADKLPTAISEWFVLIPFAINATRLLALACVVGACLRPGSLTSARLALILLGAYLTGQSPGGYTYAFVTFLIFLERWERPGQKVMLGAAYLLSVPYDVVLWEVLRYAGPGSYSWLTGVPVVRTFGISVGMFARPMLLLIAVWAVAIDSLLLIARAPKPARPQPSAPVAA